MAFLGPIPSILVEAILTCSSATDLAPEIYDILDPSFSLTSLLGWNHKWVVSPRIGMKGPSDDLV